MRVLLLPGFILLLFGCSDEREDVVINYLRGQNRGGSDISISVRSIVNMESISAGDSVDILEADYSRKRENFIRGYNDLMLTSQALKNNMNERSRIQSGISGQPMNIDPADSSNTNQMVWIDSLERRVVKGNAAAMIYKQKQLVQLRRIMGRINRYKENPGVILARSARVTYSIEESGNNTEITKTFIFSENGELVLDVTR